MTSEDLIRLYGADGVVFLPECSRSNLDPVTAEFLSSVGLPNDRVFVSRAGMQGPERDPYELGHLFDLDDRHCPPESRSWQVLGYLPAALVVLDPASGKVYVFQESALDYQLMHRDIESLVYCLTEFRKLDDAYKEAYPDSPDVEALVDNFQQAVNSVDLTPLSDQESEWNRILDEVLEEMW
ncbi:SUKH-4 family immunity protein [Streptomyces sp. H27-D2]|nr:SUKH-4 family immunity protein [Streptomyces sp. H27-D2]